MSTTLDGVKPSQFATAVLKLNGKPFSLKDRDYLLKIYDETHRSAILRTGRQVEKSTTLAGKMLTLTLMIPYFQALYVSPTSKQTRTFSSQKIGPFINTSDFIRKYYIRPSVTINRVFERSFLNHSRIQLDYACDSADRIRGASADLLCIDEVQDIVSEIIPVIEETLSHSDYGYRLYAGTPKYTNSSIEFYWKQSTQTEWFVKCDGCNAWQIPGERNLTPNGLVCAKCGKPLNVKNGCWVDTNTHNPEFKGLHIGQLIVPWVDYNRIWYKYTKIDRKTFYNEVLGLPYSMGASPITEQDLINVSIYEPMSLDNTPKGAYYMGVDWATESGEKAYTVASLGVLNGDRVRVVYIKRFSGIESSQDYIFKTLISWAKMFNVKYIGVDWGVGSGGMNSFLREKIYEMFGEDRVIEFYYSSGLSAYARWDPVGYKFVLNRTRAMAHLFSKIKKGKILFPNYDSWKDLAMDFYNVITDIRNSGKLYYDKQPETTDDVVHSLTYMHLAAMVGIGALNFFSDTADSFSEFR